MAESGSRLPQSKDFVGYVTKCAFIFGRVPHCKFYKYFPTKYKDVLVSHDFWDERAGRCTVASEAFQIVRE